MRPGGKMRSCEIMWPAPAIIERRAIREGNRMPDNLYPPSSHAISDKRKELTPETERAFHSFSRQVFADGALSAKAKQLIAVAVAHVTQCPYCIRGHTKAALRHAATEVEIMEAIWVAAEMRAGGAYAHSTIALTVMDETHEAQTKSP
jgi:AhpD family alkylhydroperoxidase